MKALLLLVRKIKIWRLWEKCNQNSDKKFGFEFLLLFNFWLKFCIELIIWWTQVICLYLLRAENVKAECKNNDGEIVPCQTSEEHIKHLTRALTRGGAGSEIDQRLAPNSYSAEVVRLGGWYNDYLRTYTKTFHSLNPTLTFGREGKTPVTLDSEDIFYESFRKG